MKKCLICSKEIGYEYFPDNATVWTTIGNYGSQIYDSNDGYLEALICDECLKSHVDRVEEVRVMTEKKEIERKIFKPSTTINGE